MMYFWIVVAVMMLLSLAFIVMPLSRPRRPAGQSAAQASLAIHRERLKELETAHSQGQISAQALTEARDEIARLVLADSAAPGSSEAAKELAGADRGAVLGAALIIPALAVLLYFWLGDVGALNESTAPQPAPMVASAPAQDSDAEHGVAEMVARLESRLLSTPDDVQGWTLLGRSYGYLKQYDKAVGAMSKANSLEPDNPRVMADLAELLMLSNGHKIDARVQGLLDKVLALEPEHAKAKFLLGLKKPGGLKDAAAATDVVPTATVASVGGGKLVIRVSISPQLRESLPPDATVFVFARPAQGPRMPLAIVRRSARELPLQVELSDAQAMSPEHRMSQHARVIVGARVSASGNAMPSPGDLEGLSAAFDWTQASAAGGATQVEIDHVVR